MVVQPAFLVSKLEIERLVVFRDVTLHLSRVAHPKRILWDVLRDDGTGPNHGMASDSQSRKDDRTCPDGGAFANLCGQKFPILVLSPRIKVISKGAVRAYHHVVFKFYPIPKLNSALYRAVIANLDIVLYQAMGTDVAVLPYLCFWENHTELPNVG